MGSGHYNVKKRAPTPASLPVVLEASLRAGGLATLGVERDGRIVHLSDGFLVLAGLDGSAHRMVHLDTLVAELEGMGPPSSELASLLLAPYTPNEHDATLSDGRIIEAWLTPLPGGARVWTFRNVTIERQGVGSLRDAENWLRMFAAHADGIVMELDEAIRIVGLWSQGSSLIDAWQDDFHDRTLVEILGQAQGALFEERLRSVFTTGRPTSFEYVADRLGGQRVFAANAVLLPGDNRSASTVTVLVRDVTERARLQQQLLQSERLASLGLLAAGVAHEVNNPLAYMLLNLEHVARGLQTLAPKLEETAQRSAVADFESCVAIAVEGAKRVQAIVQDLRRFSRSDELEPARLVDVRDVLAFTVTMVGAEIGKRARLVRDFGEVPKVLAGEGRLNQVFLNLIINAVQALEGTDEDRNEIRLVTKSDASGNAVVEVHDTGSGIPDAHLGKIFDPFFTTKAANIGTGLGLAICHGITTSLGGELTVESHLGVGSTFRVVLPATTTRRSD